jgi:hypothetical protein
MCRARSQIGCQGGPRRRRLAAPVEPVEPPEGEGEAGDGEVAGEAGDGGDEVIVNGVLTVLSLIRIWLGCGCY